MFKLYTVPPSHPCMTAALMLQYKGLEFERIDLVPGMHLLRLRTLGFEGSRTPAVANGDDRYQGTREISRALDRVKPDPPLFPADPNERAEVERAEEYGEQVLQMMARRIGITSIRHAPPHTAPWSYGADPNTLAMKVMRHGEPFVLRVLAMDYGATDHVAQADLIALPRVIARINGWIDEGVLGGEQPNAADFQVATSLQMLLSFGDIAPLINEGPAGDLARRIAPTYAEEVQPLLPERWLEPVREAVGHTASS